MKRLKINGILLCVNERIQEFERIENIDNSIINCYRNNKIVFQFKGIKDIKLFKIIDNNDIEVGFDVNIHDNNTINQIEYQFSDEINQMACKNSLKNVNSKLVDNNDEVLNLNNKCDNLQLSINDINKNLNIILENIKSLQNKNLELDSLKTEVTNFKCLVTKDLNELNDSRYDLNTRVVAIEKKIMV